MTNLPLAPADLEGCVRGFGSSVGLPGAAYTSEEVLDWEREHFFGPSWWCIGRASDFEDQTGPRQMHGWAFTQADPSGADFEQQFGNLADHLAPYDPGSLVVGASRSYDLHANWKLVGARIDGEPMAMWLEDFWPVVDGDEQIGRLVSASHSPRLGFNMGFVWVPIAKGVPGTGLQIRSPQGSRTATVTPLPFLDPKKEIPARS